MKEHNEEVFDNPSGWVAKHIHAYVESGGEKGQYMGRETLLLTIHVQHTQHSRFFAVLRMTDSRGFTY